ncbi:MAG TPA: SDR family oxidoreductase [Vicinamibacteria bacterium]|nr:SDR family oxidoreductase [Vicinamibacteria bacterium]
MSKKRSPAAKAESAPRKVLFTGFPGFIGVRLLPRLLELGPDLQVVCLVQDRFLEVARSAIRDLEAAHPHTAERITTVVGDITEPELGLSQSEAHGLKKELREAHHLAAIYDLAVKREVGLRINLEGTRNVLDFLEDCPRLERLHYVSTAYVSGNAKGVYRETDLDVGQGFKNFYEETKFLAEVEVAKRKLPQTVYRPGIVVGDSRTGETGKFDGPYFVLAAMERIPSPGLFPRLGSGDNSVNLVPVDFIVEAYARLASTPESLGKTYNLTDPAPLSAYDMAKAMARELGKTFVYLPVPVFMAKAAFSPSFVQSFFGMPAQTIDYFDHPCVYDCSQATADLKTLGIACPSFGDYVPKLVAFYREKRGQVRREAMV